MVPSPKSEMLESAIRLILWRQFDGDVTLARLLPGDRSCVLEHGDGTKGVVPMTAVMMMEAA
jgi:hypothetical protein